MAKSIPIALTVLMVVCQTGWSADAEKKKKKKAAPETAKITQKAKWEYKVVRGYELEGSQADALNKLGEDGWELVFVDAPEPTPANTSTGNPPTPDEMWRALTRGESVEKIDLNQRTDIRDRMTQRGMKLPDDAMLTKESYKESLEKQRASVRPFSRLTTFYFKRAKE